MCGCPEHLDSPEVQSAVPLFKAHRDNKWTTLLFPGEQEKAPVKKPSAKPQWIPDKGKNAEREAAFASLFWFFSPRCKPHSAGFWLSQLLIHMLSSGRVRELLNKALRWISAGRGGLQKKVLISQGGCSKSWTHTLRTLLCLKHEFVCWSGVSGWKTWVCLYQFRDKL